MHQFLKAVLKGPFGVRGKRKYGKVYRCSAKLIYIFTYIYRWPSMASAVFFNPLDFSDADVSFAENRRGDKSTCFYVKDYNRVMYNNALIKVDTYIRISRTDNRDHDTNDIIVGKVQAFVTDRSTNRKYIACTEPRTVHRDEIPCRPLISISFSKELLGSIRLHPLGRYRSALYVMEWNSESFVVIGERK